MRQGKKFRVDLEETGETNCDFIVDWNASPSDVLKSVDEALKAHGLEIVVHGDTCGSFEAYSIKRLRKGKKGRQ